MITQWYFVILGFARRGCLTLRAVTRYMMVTDPSSFSANVPSSPPSMASCDLADKIFCLTLARTKLEKELDLNDDCILEDRNVKIKKWLQSCKIPWKKPSSKIKKPYFSPHESPTKQPWNLG